MASSGANRRESHRLTTASCRSALLLPYRSTLLCVTRSLRATSTTVVLAGPKRGSSDSAASSTESSDSSSGEPEAEASARFPRPSKTATVVYAQTTGARPFAAPRRRQLGQRYSKIRQFREIETGEWSSFAIRIVCYRIRFLCHLDRDGDVFSSAASGVPSPVTKRLVESPRLLNCSPAGRNIAVAWADPNDDPQHSALDSCSHNSSWRKNRQQPA